MNEKPVTENMHVVKGIDGSWKLDEGTHLVEIACKHRKSGACGGCYARAFRALERLKADGNELAARFMDACRGDSR